MPKYYMPTTLLSGENCVKRHPRHLIHGKKCIIITGKNSAVISGALKDVTDVLDENNIEYFVYNRITSSTTINDIYSLGRMIMESGYEYIIGIGGGSTLDAAKAAAVYATNSIEPMDIFREEYENPPLRVVCIPTTAGTGSDTTQYVMLTLDEQSNKRSFKSEMCFPYATYLDTRYTMTLPLEVTRNTAIDALCHAVESYLNTKASSFSDMVALEAIRLIGECSDALVTGQISVADRKKLLIAASSGGMAVAHTGLNIPHALGYQLTCRKNIPHGRANGALLVEFISLAAKADLMRAVRVIDAFGKDLTGFKQFISRLFPEPIEITEDEIDGWTHNYMLDSAIENCPVPMTEKDIKLMYKNALLNKDRTYTRWNDSL